MAMVRIIKVEVRRQHAKRGRSGWEGPDTYVAVQVVPPGVEPLTVLNSSVAIKRGIKIVHFGEGYARHSGPRSALGRALTAAQAFADSILSDEEKALVALAEKEGRRDP